MTEIPENEVTLNDLMLWYEMSEQLSKLKAAEALLRTRCFKHYFPAPNEGVNSYALDDGWMLKAQHKINRNVDIAMLTTLTPNMQAAGINVDTLFPRKPDLAVKEYRKVQDEPEKLKLVDQCLVIKPGMPDMEIVLPKRR